MSDENKDGEILLSKQEVWDIVSFARALVGGFYPGAVNPMLLNQRMQDISYSPREPTQSDLDNALSDPKNNEESLRSFIEHFELISMPMKRIFSYMASHLALDLTYSVTNVSKPDEYTKPAFKRDQEKLYNYFDRFDHKGFFRNAIKQMLRNELYFFSIRDDGQNVVLQELPIQYCKVTGRWDYGLLMSFNMYYFLQPGIDIDLYSAFFKKKYIQMLERGGVVEYDPALPVSLRGNSQYVYWVDLPPDIGWVFKLDTSLITAVPYFAALMPDLINQGVMRSLQKDTNMAAASKMLLGQVPMQKDNKGGSIKDMISVDPVTLGKFLSLVKSSVSTAIKVAAAPLEDMQAFAFEGDNELYDKYLRTALASSGMDTALIFSSQLKANLIDSQLSFQSDSKIMEDQLYPQFNAFLNYWANRELKKYQYAFELEGNDYYLDRKERFANAMTLADKGIVLPQKIAAAIGVKPQTLYRWVEETKATGFVDNLTPILSPFQMSPDKGRPSKDDSELGDSGAQTREAGGNIPRGGSST